MEAHSSTLRVLQVLENLGTKPSGLSIDALVRETQIRYTTAYRILQTLLAQQYVEITTERKYRLSSKLFQLASAQFQSQDLLVEKAHPHLQELFYKTKETVHLAILSGEKALYVDKIDSNHILRMHSAIGSASDIYCTGLGKALLAWLPEAIQDALIRTLDFKTFTENTIISEETLRQHLGQIRTQKYAEDNEEHEPHIYCLAVPIFDAQNQLRAAVSVSSPIVRVSSEYKGLALQALWDCGARISKNLGNSDYKACLASSKPS